MKVLKYSDPSYQAELNRLNRRYSPAQNVVTTVRQILEEVAKSGDSALLHFTAQFGGPQLPNSKIKVDDSEIQKAISSLPSNVEQAILASKENVTLFAKKTLPQTWSTTNPQGVVVGERYLPFPRVGIYIPGGSAPLISTAIMTTTIAATAGVPEIVAVTPPQPDGSINPALLAALHFCGAAEIYRIGGAQAIAALAFGTQTIPPVRKIFGPGSPWVVEAKRQLFGTVAVDLLPGPSEILVIADESANPSWVAADLLAQAEHGHGSIAILLTHSEQVLNQVANSIAVQLNDLPRAQELQQALQNSQLILTHSLDESIQIANLFAAEHVAIATKSPDEIAEKIHSAGAIFLGHYTPVALGDFLAGPSHVLPTGGAAKSFPGLTTDQFFFRMSFVSATKDSLQKSDPFIQTFSRVEGLAAHGKSSSIRLV
ncbi:MAG: histidinol dehydrogenase [Chthoniobacterales bacterium]|nr:histidinol dehydrogenase [Chthoniobacterales bacterium]